MLALLVLAALAGLGVLYDRIMDNPRGDFESGVLFFLARVYLRLVHGLRVRGRRHIPKDRYPGPLIIVANHTAGVDPIAIQAHLPFFIRWVMAADMRVPVLEWFWRRWRIIFVNREQRDGQAVREALRELKDGGVIGIFPEGALERPPRQVLRFQEGIGLLIRKSKAPVLPVIVDGAPQYDPAWASLWRTSQTVVRFCPIIRYEDSGLSAKEIAEDLRTRFVKWTDWPANDADELGRQQTDDGPKSGRRVPFGHDEKIELPTGSHPPSGTVS